MSTCAPDFLATVDLTPPAVTLSALTPTTSRGPQVHVGVTDRYGIPNGTTFTLDVDLNNDGNFTDAGEAGYASGTLTGGQATITLPALPSASRSTASARRR
jgi:hypothetical protein